MTLRNAPQKPRKNDVLQLFDNFPQATSPWLANRLGVTSSYIRETLFRNGRRLALSGVLGRTPKRDARRKEQ